MPARPNLSPADQMTIEEFLGFTQTRPDEERWELIEGVPVLNASPVNVHQVIVTNVVTFLMMEKRRISATWLPVIGVGTRVPISPNSLPQPDVYVQAGPSNWDHITDDALVIFEVLSRSNTKTDQAWRRRVYASVPNCQHYVTVSMKAAEVTAYDRAAGWKARDVAGIDAALDLPALGVELPLVDVYRYTPLGT
jgi:Uma2 family endonuclease